MVEVVERFPCTWVFEPRAKDLESRSNPFATMLSSFSGTEDECLNLRNLMDSASRRRMGRGMGQSSRDLRLEELIGYVGVRVHICPGVGVRVFPAPGNPLHRPRPKR